MHGWQVGAIRRGLLREWPLTAASLPPALAVLVTNLLPGDANADGGWVACLVAIAEQQIFGAVALRDSDFSIADRVRRNLLDLAIGLVIIMLEVLVPAH